MSGEADRSQVCAASMRAFTPLIFQDAIFMDEGVTQLLLVIARLDRAIQ
jgi:hypothetical protein